MTANPEIIPHMAPLMASLVMTALCLAVCFDCAANLRVFDSVRLGFDKFPSLASVSGMF